MDINSLYLANYHDLKALNQKTETLTDSFVLSFLSFCQSSKKYIDITIGKISHYTGFSQKMVSSSLSSLEQTALISKKRHKSNRIKCLYRSTAAIHYEKTTKLTTITGSYAGSLIVTRILYALNNTDIEIEGIKWTTFNIRTLSFLIKKSKRTTYRVVKYLVDKGILIRLAGTKQRKAYYTLSAEIVEKLHILIKPILAKEETNFPNGTQLEDYTIYTQDTYPNNNNYEGSVNFLNKASGNDPPLSVRQMNYIKGAIKKSLPHHSDEQGRYALIIEEVIYAFKNMSNKNKKLSFINVLNILMKVLRTGNWKRPYGFEKYTEKGRERHSQEWGHYDEQIRLHEERKKMWRPKTSMNGSGGPLSIKNILKNLGNIFVK